MKKVDEKLLSGKRVKWMRLENKRVEAVMMGRLKAGERVEGNR